MSPAAVAAAVGAAAAAVVAQHRPRDAIQDAVIG